jgi:transcriptional regulator with XRE-family HTH domain
MHRTTCWAEPAVLRISGEFRLIANDWQGLPAGRSGCRTGLQSRSFWVTLISGYMSTFGKMISGARKVLGISQKTLASRIKKEDGEPISAQYLNDIEHDRRNAPSEFLISQLAKELTLSKDHLCLAAGTIPADVKENVAAAETETVDAAFSAFRRAVKKGNRK